MTQMDELLKQHQETYYELKRKTLGLFSIAAALKIRAGLLRKRECVDVFEEVENKQLSELLDLHAKSLEEIAKSFRDNVDKFVDEENKMTEVIEIQLKSVNEKVERLKREEESGGGWKQALRESHTR